MSTNIQDAPPVIRRRDKNRRDASNRRSRPASWFVAHFSFDKLFNRDQNRNKTKTKKDKPKPPETVLAEVHTREVHRLEALCEARTKQLNIAKMQLQTSNLAFDGMSIANKYLAHDCDGFSSPALKRENKRLKDEIEEHKATVRKRWEQKQEMEELLGKLKEEHKEYVKNLELENERTITYQRENMEADHNEELIKERESFRYQMNCMKHEHETHVSTMKIDHTAAIERLQMQRREEIKELQRRQENQMEELHKQHQDKLEDITGRFDGIKLNLLNKVESLKAECDGFRDRARACEEALQRDSDYKVQCALAPYKNLPQEIESLKTVIEMKNEEINKLRTKNIELTKKLEELPIAEEKIISLQQKKENLEAIISMKTDHEKVLHERCQSLMKKYDKESKANKRLSMDYEELMWKLSESFNEGSVDTGSQENLHCKKLGMSESAGSPDMGRRLRTPTGSEGSPSKSPAYRRTLSSSVDDREEKKFKRRSGNFLLDAGKQIRSTSPLAKQNPLTKSWCPGTESPSPTQSHRLSPNLMSQSWCVDMSENEQSASKLPKSRSSLEPDNEKPRSRRRLIKESDRPDSEIVSDDSLSNSVRSNGLEVSADSKAEAKEEVQVKGRVRKNTVTLDDSESVFSGKEDAQAVNTSSLQQNGHVLKSPEKPEAKSVKSSMSESSSSETVTLQRGAVMCPPSKLPTYQDRKTTRSHKESMV